MAKTPWPLVSADEMRALDRHTIEALGIPGDVLMESAGRAVVERVLTRYAQTRHPERPIAVVCGRGNNGGDGFVVARQLALLGHPVVVSVLGDPDRMSDDAARNHARLRTLGIETISHPEQGGVPSIVVDALFGTGLTRALEGEAAEHVGWINDQHEHQIPVIAVDLPSGLDSETGQIHGAATRCSETVTIGLPKIGLTLEPGRSHAGAIRVARIGIVDRVPGVAPRGELWNRETAAGRLPHRDAAGHKGSFGHVLVIAGSRGKTGAAHLSALGAARIGAGLVTVACPAGVNEILEIKTTEAMTAPVPDTEEHSLAASSAAHLVSLAQDRDVVALGPGIGTHPETVGLVYELAKRIERPLVLDADALNAFAEDPALLASLKSRSAATVLTPHPGEAARLLASDARSINRDRVAAARSLAERSGAIVVLKGAGTVIADPSGRVAVNPTGGPALAAGGTGDVLTGVIAGLLAQCPDTFDAASLGVYLHGLAAEELAERRGSSGLLAHEIADELPRLCASLRAVAAQSNILLPERSRALLLRFPDA